MNNYYVCYTTIDLKEHTRSFNNLEEAKNFLTELIKTSNILYGYISDDEALEFAEEFKSDFEDKIINTMMI